METRLARGRDSRATGSGRRRVATRDSKTLQFSSAPAHSTMGGEDELAGRDPYQLLEV
jgi:hypothetical protein